MTLYAAKDGNAVKVVCTYGPVTFECKEDVSHLRSFWNQLGSQLDAVEATSKEGS